MSLALTQKNPTRQAPLNRSEPLRFALIGCGAISRQFHLPVLAGHDGIHLAAVVDRDAVRAKAVAAEYKVPLALQDAAELTPDLVDAVILATPPAHHASGAMALIRRGIHVLVEKPLAINSDDAEEMVRVADEAGVVLA
ncbi:MAG TPA: Gfo/Idh/MocA family oxidoreductase, partial [Gemmataceae bacterium]|nr:Gfo/Idh/MocA family oxidoreductase [Gemmataceae bacterium]